jgi:hypothetical protein
MKLFLTKIKKKSTIILRFINASELFYGPRHKLFAGGRLLCVAIANTRKVKFDKRG